MGETRAQIGLFADEIEDDLVFERRLASRGVEYIAGVDEAGRGCLAGPVVAAAVVLHPGQRIDGVTDSKVLSAEKRTDLAEQIRNDVQYWAVAACSPSEIDELNILWAAMEAMRRSVEELERSPDHVLIDGNTLIPRLNRDATPIVKGDSRSHSIAAASILAKTHRDAIMMSLHAQHPQYGWDTNMGYPTAAHYAGLARHGVTEHHRKSFRLSR